MPSDNEILVIEGIDGAGKSTISERLSESHGFEYMCQPENSWVGEVAREALNRDVEPSCDLFLHMAAHANQQPKINDILETSDIVFDRYYHSRVAYQAVQTSFSADEIEEMHLGWSAEPSKVILLDIPAREALNRKKASKDKFEHEQFLSEVRTIYLKSFKDRENTVVVDATMPEEDVYREIESHI